MIKSCFVSVSKQCFSLTYKGENVGRTVYFLFFLNFQISHFRACPCNVFKEQCAFQSSRKLSISCNRLYCTKSAGNFNKMKWMSTTSKAWAGQCPWWESVCFDIFVQSKPAGLEFSRRMSLTQQLAVWRFWAGVPAVWSIVWEKSCSKWCLSAKRTCSEAVGVIPCGDVGKYPAKV